MFDNLEDRVVSHLVESFLQRYRYATGKRNLKLLLDHWVYPFFKCEYISRSEVLDRQVKNLLLRMNKMSMDGSGNVLVNGLESLYSLVDEPDIDTYSSLSVKFNLGSAECTVETYTFIPPIAIDE